MWKRTWSPSPLSMSKSNHLSSTMSLAGAVRADDDIDPGRKIDAQAAEGREILQFKVLDHI